jgi:hypothetical protein
MGRDFSEAANLFVWSVWAEIGVPSRERRPMEIAIDLEPLIRLTDAVGERDQRLLSHAQAWLDAFPELVSKARLKRLGGNVRLASPRSPRTNAMSGRVELNVSHASALQLRIRSALGVSARAEIVRQLVLDTPRNGRSASDLAQLCGYTKRNVEKALEALERSGWVVRIRGGASLRWSAADHAELCRVFAPIPSNNTSFMAIAEILDMLVSLDDVDSAPTRARSAAGRQSLAELRTTADWGGVRLPEPSLTEDAWEAALVWVGGLPATAF